MAGATTMGTQPEAAVQPSSSSGSMNTNVPPTSPIQSSVSQPSVTQVPPHGTVLENSQTSANSAQQPGAPVAITAQPVQEDTAHLSIRKSGDTGLEESGHQEVSIKLR